MLTAHPGTISVVASPGSSGRGKARNMTSSQDGHRMRR
jgi:hypothetical protein